MNVDFRWRCKQCRRLLAGNPKACGVCGHRDFERVLDLEPKPCHVDRVFVVRVSCIKPDGHQDGHEYPAGP